jgi:beta-glucuronidase
MADVYLNGQHIGSHEGGFTPFQIEITGFVKAGDNALIIRVDNQRRKDGIPGMGYDWFNYGGITREVNLIEAPLEFIDDYFIQLAKNSNSVVSGWIRLNGSDSKENITIKIPELKINYTTQTSENGFAEVRFSGKFHLWSPDDPKLYKVIIASANDTVEDEIGFRNIQVSGSRILLNGKPIFIKGVNIHEERPIQAARACTEADALILLNWAKELGCNLVRLAHYPHSEHIVRLAEKMGIMVWDEIPVYQHIEFASSGFRKKMENMMNEMMRRDRNRCSVVVWSLSNETYTTTPERSEVLVEMTEKCRAQDSSRLITSVLSNQKYENNTFEVWDPICRLLDIICINEYLNWYVPRQGNPSETRWKFIVEKPLIISEFGGEAKFGSDYGPGDEAAWWNEEYQENIYREQVEMFAVTPNLVGVCPWLLVDYRSPVRMHPLYQGGYNRKGLLSEFGEKKKAWFVIRDYYKSR